MLELIFTVVLAVTAPGRSAAAPPIQAPKMPYLDWGACPFECCTYRRWTATRDTPVLRERRHGSPVAFRVRSGASITALTGVVVTSSPGRARAHGAFTLGDEKQPVSFKDGDEFFMLHYLGEGYGLLWFRGQSFSDQWWADELGFTADGLVEVLQLPQVQWWVKVKDAAGHIGWSEQPEDYEGADACG